MFGSFWRAGSEQNSKAGGGQGNFRARSAARDSETDRTRTLSILTAIETALHASETEQSGLSHRVDDVLARAAVTMGNGSDEYLYRDQRDAHHQNLFDLEISNGQRRLQQLSEMIVHFRFLRTVLLSRFPDLKAPEAKNLGAGQS